MEKLIGITDNEKERHDSSLIRFNPQGKRFVFTMLESDCEYKRSGVCPIKERIDTDCPCNQILKSL